MKKRFRLLLLLFLCSFLVSPVYAADIKGCSILGDDIQIDEKIANTVHIIILIIQIAVPVILVVLGMIDLLKASIAGKEDEIKKAQSIFIKRLITGALVFFVFVIVKMLVSFVADDSTDTMNCVHCFVNGSENGICNKVS